VEPLFLRKLGLVAVRAQTPEAEVPRVVSVVDAESARLDPQSGGPVAAGRCLGEDLVPSAARGGGEVDPEQEGVLLESLQLGKPDLLR